MAAFNTLAVPRPTPCPQCAHDGLIRLQFSYGDTWEHHYQLGDVVKWGGNDVGTRSPGHVEILGYPEPCPKCGLETTQTYVIEIVNQRLTGYRVATEDEVRRLERAE